MKNTKQLDLLEQELVMLQENIQRVRKYQKDNDNQKWIPSQSNVVGELKHRMLALKQRMTLVSNLTTRDLFN